MLSCVPPWLNHTEFTDIDADSEELGEHEVMDAIKEVPYIGKQVNHFESKKVWSYEAQVSVVKMGLWVGCINGDKKIASCCLQNYPRQ